MNEIKVNGLTAIGQYWTILDNNPGNINDSRNSREQKVIHNHADISIQILGVTGSVCEKSNGVKGYVRINSNSPLKYFICIYNENIISNPFRSHRINFCYKNVQ